MNIYVISEQFKIPITKLKRMHALGLLNAELVEQSAAEKAMTHVRRGRNLPATLLVEFIRDPELIANVSQPAAQLIRRQIKIMGNIAGQALPAGSHNMIINAALKSREAAEQLAGWIASIIPDNGCDYAWIAVRALLNVEPLYFELTASSVSRAIIQARQAQELADLSALRAGRTQFFPIKKEFDL